MIYHCADRNPDQWHKIVDCSQPITADDFARSALSFKVATQLRDDLIEIEIIGFDRRPRDHGDDFLASRSQLRVHSEETDRRRTPVGHAIFVGGKLVQRRWQSECFRPRSFSLSLGCDLGRQRLRE
jgi:hypothetical protein